NTSEVVVDSEYGSFRPRTPGHVVDLIAQIIERMWPANVEGSFDAIADIFAGATDDGERDRLLRAVEHLSKSRLWVWKKHGPAVQVALAQHLARIPRNYEEAIKPLIVRTYSNILDSEITETEFGSSQVTLQTAVVRPLPDLLGARCMALFHLQQLYLSEASEPA